MESTTTALEITYLKTLIALFTSTAFSVDTARASAKAFVAMLPFTSPQDVRDKVEKYVNEYPLFSSLRITLDEPEVPLVTNDQIERMRILLARGDVDGLLAASHEDNVFI